MTAPSLGFSAYLLRIFLVPLFSSLIKLLTVLVWLLAPAVVPLLSGQHLDIELLTANIWALLSSQFVTHLVAHPCFTRLALKIRWEITVQKPFWSWGRQHRLISHFFTKPIFSLWKAVRLNLPLVCLFWLFPIAFFSFMCPGMASVRVCSTIFLWAEVKLNSLLVPRLSFLPF